MNRDLTFEVVIANDVASITTIVGLRPLLNVESEDFVHGGFEVIKDVLGFNTLPFTGQDHVRVRSLCPWVQILGSHPCTVSTLPTIMPNWF